MTSNFTAAIRYFRTLSTADLQATDLVLNDLRVRASVPSWMLLALDAVLQARLLAEAPAPATQPACCQRCGAFYDPQQGGTTHVVCGECLSHHEQEYERREQRVRDWEAAQRVDYRRFSLR